MSKIFNPVRFAKLFTKHTTEHYKGYLMALGVLVGVMVLGGAFLIYIVEARLDHSTQSAFFLMILLIAGTIFTSTIFDGLGEKKKAIPYLTLPASHFEKYLVAWLYSFLLFLLIYTCSFYIVAWLLLNVGKVGGNERIRVLQDSHLLMGLSFGFLHAVALWGAVYFNKMNFIKTAFVFFTCLGILFLFNKLTLSAMIGRTVDVTPPFGILRFPENGQQVEISLSREVSNPFLLFVTVGLMFFFWIAAYYELKEKQV